MDERPKRAEEKKTRKEKKNEASPTQNAEAQKQKGRAA
jgi:hypothetical protein